MSDDPIGDYLRTHGDEPPEGTGPMRVSVSVILWEGMSMPVIGTFFESIGQAMRHAPYHGPGGMNKDAEVRSGVDAVFSVGMADMALTVQLDTRLATGAELEADMEISEAAEAAFAARDSEPGLG